MQVERRTEKIIDVDYNSRQTQIIGADADGIVRSPILLALQHLPVDPTVRASWSPAEEKLYQEKVAFRAAADKIPIPKSITAE